MHFDRRLWQLSQGLRGRMAAGVALGLVSLAAGIARFAFLGWVLALAFRAAPPEALLPPLAGAIAAILLRALLEHARAMMAHGTAGEVQIRLRRALHEKIVALGPAWFAQERTGGVMLAVVDGVEQLQTFFGQYVPQLVVAACAPFAIFAFVAIWDLPVATVLLAAALLALIGPMALHWHEQRASIARSAAFKAYGEEFLDAVQGLPTLKAFGQSGAYGERLAERAHALSAQTFWVLARSVATRGIVDLGTALGAAAALALGAWRVREGEMSIAALLIVLMAGTEIFRPLRDLRGILHQGLLGRSAAASIRALLDASSSLPASGTASADGLAPAVAFDNVHFAYPGSRRPAHTGLSFSVPTGARVGIVGASGAGKSSIVRLLLREHDPQPGTVLLGGRDIRELGPESLRARIAVVAQDATLFHGTIEDNLRLGRPDATQAEIESAARAANAHEFIAALPDGYQTVVGERGAQLSGGQRQRLAIARALLRDSPILVLDEALSSVDAENEAVIQQALDRLMAGRTTLILAHRLSSVIAADRILVLDEGRVAEAGRHDELMARGGLYRRLMGAQVADMDIESMEPMPDPLAPRPTTGADAAPVRREIDEDAAQIGWRETIATLAGFIRPWRWILALTVALGIGRVAAFIGVGALGALVIAALRAGRPFETLTIALLVTAPLAGLFHWLESWLAHDMAYRLLAEMRIKLFATLDRLAPAYLLTRRSGDLVALATQDIETVEYFYAHTVAPAVVAVLVPLTVIGVLGALCWPLVFMLAPFLAYALLAPIRGRARIDRLGGEAREALGALGAHLTETIQGLSELLAFQATARRTTAFMALAERAGRARLELLRDLSRQTAAMEAATSLGGLAIAGLGAILVAHGVLSAGLLPLLVLVGIAAFLPISEIAQVSRQLADTIASTRRLHVVEHEPVRVADGAAAPPAREGGSAFGFERAGFTYPGRSRPALEGVSFDVRPGSTVALVGPSGAGKSTVANLLLRFWDPDEGMVTLDGADLRTLRLDALRGRVALVAQDTYLFNDTLEANIRIARPDASEDDLLHAVRQAALRPFVAALPDGLATRVGERGVQLSGGQRQRVAIARAFLKDAPVLVLDEATSHLDAISEAEVRAALGELMQHRTTLLIAHRLSTVRAADTILVLERGRIAEQGSHDELLERNGVYARLVRRQMSAGWVRAAVLALALLSGITAAPHPAAAADPAHFLAFSDPHFNPMDDPALVNDLATHDVVDWPAILDLAHDPHIAQYGKDTKWPLLRSLLDEMQSVEPHPAFLMVLGDFLAHRFRRLFDAAETDHSDAAYASFVNKTMAFAAQEILRRFPDTPILAVLGNNDEACGDYMLEPGGPFLKDTLPIIRRMLGARLGPGFDDEWLADGNYMLPHPTISRLRVLFANTVFFSRQYNNACGNPAAGDPGQRTLDWLAGQLENARVSGQQVWLMYHIPPGADAYATLHNPSCPVMMWAPEYAQHFAELMQRYSDTVAASFAGHTHMDEFRLQGRADHYDVFTLITSAISPIFGQNPGFERYTYGEDGRLLDRETWYLANVPVAGVEEKPDWKLEYSFVQTWKLPDIGLASLVALDQRLANSPADQALWTSIFPVGRIGLWHLSPDQYRLPEPLFRTYHCTEDRVGAEAFRQCACPATQ